MLRRHFIQAMSGNARKRGIAFDDPNFSIKVEEMLDAVAYDNPKWQEVYNHFFDTRRNGFKLFINLVRERVRMTS